MDPGGWVSLQVGTLWTGTTLDSAPKRILKCLKGGLRLSKGRPGKHPHLCHRDPCPPAAKELPVIFPPNALPTQIHTNTPIPCAAASRGGGGGRKRSGRKASKLPFQAGSRAPEKFFPPRRAPETPTGRVSRTLRRLTGAEGRRAPSWKRSGSGSAAKRGQHQKGEIPELDIERLFCRELPGPN